MSGYEAPNYTQAPNAFFDKVMQQIDTVAELKVTLAVMRQTFGYHRDEKELSLTRLEELTGLRRESVSDGVKRGLKRGSLSRRKHGNSYLYCLKVVGKPDQERESASPQTGPEVVGKPDQQVVRKPDPEKESPKEKVKESTERETSSLSGGGSSASPEPAPLSQKEIAKQTKNEAGRELMERVNAKREQGANIHSPTERERKDFAWQYDQARKDGHDRDTRLLAFDRQVAKAAGEIEGEHAAWCGYRTALTAVLEGWRPEETANAQTELEKKRLEKENAEIDEMAREAARLMQQEFGHG